MRPRSDHNVKTMTPLITMAQARARTGRRIRALAVVGLLVVLAALVLARGRDRFEGKVLSGEGKKAHVIYQRELSSSYLSGVFQFEARHEGQAFGSTVRYACSTKPRSFFSTN